MGEPIETKGGSSDADVIARSLSVPDAFGVLFDRHFDAVHRYLARRVGRERADDLASQTFVVAFERRGSFRPNALAARPWLFGIATHLCQGRAREAVARIPHVAHARPPHDRAAPIRPTASMGAAQRRRRHRVGGMLRGDRTSGRGIGHRSLTGAGRRAWTVGADRRHWPLAGARPWPIPVRRLRELLPGRRDRPRAGMRHVCAGSPPGVDRGQRLRAVGGHDRANDLHLA